MSQLCYCKINRSRHGVSDEWYSPSYLSSRCSFSLRAAAVSCEGLMQERTMAATEIARQAVRALFCYKDVLSDYQTKLTNINQPF